MPLNLQHFAYLDGWRGVAITLLLIGHFCPVPGINFGTLGVNFFFVLSGLLMARLLFSKAVPIKLFYQRRFSRIFPAHLLFIALIVAYFFLAGRTVNWSETLTALLFVNNYFPGEVGHNVMPFGHIWSLSVEEHSYVVLSLIALLSRRKNLAPQWGIAFVSALFIIADLAYWIYYKPNIVPYEIWGHTEIADFGIFISALFYVSFENKSIPRLPKLTYPAMLVVGLAFYWWSVPQQLTAFVGVAIIALVLNLLHKAPDYKPLLLSFSPLRQLGLWSFSLYLWQQPFYLAYHRGVLTMWQALALALIAGISSYYLIEKPIRNFLNSRWASE